MEEEIKKVEPEISDAELIQQYDPEKYREEIAFQDCAVVFIIRQATADELQDINDAHGIQKWNKDKKRMESTISSAGEKKMLTLVLRGWRNMTWELLEEWAPGISMFMQDGKKCLRTGEIKFNIETAQAICSKIPKFQNAITNRALKMNKLTEKIEEQQTENF